jgi:inorganic phosphate transporter, PiT family
MDVALLAMPVALLLAWVNGANDNIKGAATLVGSGLASARAAIVLASTATAAGGLASLWLALGLLQAFSGHGMVPASLAGTAQFLVPVGLGAAATVGLATRLGLPVSTTHALIGGLLGVGLVAAPAAVQPAGILNGLALPLVWVPLVAMLLAIALIPIVRGLRRRIERMDAACLCEDLEVEVAGVDGADTAARWRARLGTTSSADCKPAAGRSIAPLAPARALDAAHVLSALGVSFARGVNDTPKIAAVGLAGAGLGVIETGVPVVIAMALGGLMAARRITETMAWRVARMDPSEGLGGNLVTTGLVLTASGLALPVSTTHVSCGALFGIAAANQSGRRRTIVVIALAWGVTMPLGAMLGVLCHYLLNGVVI